MYHGFLKIIVKLVSTLIILRNGSPNHYIRLISEGSCDTEDWKIQLCHHTVGTHHILDTIK